MTLMISTGSRPQSKVVNEYAHVSFDMTALITFKALSVIPVAQSHSRVT